MLPNSTQVDTSSTIFMCISIIICSGVPIGLAIRWKARHKKDFSFIPCKQTKAGHIQK